MAFQNTATMLECVSCANAKQALKKLAEEHFDLVTTSLMLPDMDGLELCRLIRSDKHTRLIPVIVISGDADERLITEGFSSGVTDYFNKSRGHAELASFIFNYLERTYGAAPRILLVEDSLTVATMLRKMLQKQGMQVVHYPKAENAMDLLNEVQNEDDTSLQFDVVLTDFNLEGDMTGGDLLYGIRMKLGKSPHELPVLVMTANDNVEQQVELFNAGANDFITKPAVEQILIARIKALVLIRQQYLTLERQKQKMELLSLTDNLTGAFNRRYLSEYGHQLASKASCIPLTIMIADIDHFKTVNDTYGHLKGDQVLSNVCATIKLQIPDNAVTIRYGGEEFCIIIPKCNRAQSQKYAESMRLAVKDLATNDIRVTLSVGICIIEQAGHVNLEACLNNADVALYSAKKNGRDRVEFFSPEPV